MIFHRALAVLFSLLIANSASAENWFSGSFGTELTLAQDKDLQEYYKSVPQFVLGRITSSFQKKGETSLRVKSIGTFKSSSEVGDFSVQVPYISSHLDEGKLFIFAVKKARPFELFGVKTGEFGFSQDQETVFFRFKQLLGFSNELGMDQWLTCQKDDDCTFVKTCKSYASVNVLHAPKYFVWRDRYHHGETCGPYDGTFLEKYRPKCLKSGVCNKADR